MNFIIESKPRNDEIADRWKNRKNFEPHRGLLDVNYRGRCSLDFPRTTHSFQNKPYPKTQWIGSVQPGKFRNNGGGPLFLVGPIGILVEWIAPFISLT